MLTCGDYTATGQVAAQWTEQARNDTGFIIFVFCELFFTAWQGHIMKRYLSRQASRCEWGCMGLWWVMAKLTE